MKLRSAVGYALLKVTGKQQGLDNLRKELGSRWSKSPRKETVVNAAEPSV